MLKTTARMLPGLIAIALGLSLARVSAEPVAGDPSAAFDAGSAARPGGFRFDDKRQQADDLLRRARQAMAENDLETADRLVSQAEALDAPYSPMSFGDTPKKLRRELDRKLLVSGKLAGRPGATGASRAAGGPDRTPVDPFAGRDGDLSRVASPLADPKTQAKLCIFKARRELDQGNTPAAGYWYREAVKYPATFAPGEDSPEKLAGDIRGAGGSLDETPRPAGLAGSRAVVPLPPLEPTGPLPVPPDARPAVPGPSSSVPGMSGRAGSNAAPGDSSSKPGTLWPWATCGGPGNSFSRPGLRTFSTAPRTTTRTAWMP